MPPCSTRNWRRRRSGSARAWRRGAPATRAGCARSSSCASSAASGANASGRWRCGRRTPRRRASWCSRRLAVTHGFGAAPVIANFSARIMRGDRIGIIGPNGCGKSTLIKLLVGELEPTAGDDPPRHRPGLRLLRSAARTTRSVGLDHGQRDRRQRRYGHHRRSAAARVRLPARFSVSAGAAARTGEHAVGRRAQPPAAGAPVRPPEQSSGDGRADQRSGCGDAGSAGGDGRELCGNAAARQPRPRISRQRRHQHAGVRGRRPRQRICGRLHRLAAAAQDRGARGDGGPGRRAPYRSLPRSPSRGDCPTTSSANSRPCRRRFNVSKPNKSSCKR